MITDNIKKTCIKDTLGDGNCDPENNIAECSYDEGDCCAATCIENCSTNTCNYECASKNSYDCIDPGAGCLDCDPAFGTCANSDTCYTNDDDVMQSV